VQRKKESPLQTVSKKKETASKRRGKMTWGAATLEPAKTIIRGGNLYLTWGEYKGGRIWGRNGKRGKCVRRGESIPD